MRRRAFIAPIVLLLLLPSLFAGASVKPAEDRERRPHKRQSAALVRRERHHSRERKATRREKDGGRARADRKESLEDASVREDLWIKDDDDPDDSDLHKDENGNIDERDDESNVKDNSDPDAEDTPYEVDDDGDEDPKGPEFGNEDDPNEADADTEGEVVDGKDSSNPEIAAGASELQGVQGNAEHDASEQMTHIARAPPPSEAQLSGTPPPVEERSDPVLTAPEMGPGGNHPEMAFGPAIPPESLMQVGDGSSALPVQPSQAQLRSLLQLKGFHVPARRRGHAGSGGSRGQGGIWREDKSGLASGAKGGRRAEGALSDDAADNLLDSDVADAARNGDVESLAEEADADEASVRWLKEQLRAASAEEAAAERAALEGDEREVFDMRQASGWSH
eukprot:TRINITY_DN6494_c0_g2_i2.p1 TRINITY_DN6494_c0_g2~~TRINITY_DN6494_c0_g2_i2.p1  ORF type:complete len:393 (-),score=109.17 TRINITY_DN6494_c0_g2_i2:544-1722(-)